MKLKFFFVICMLSWSSTIACDCLWGGSFLDSSNHKDIVFLGRVIDYDQYSYIELDDTSFYSPSVMIIEIQEIFKVGENSFTVYDHIDVGRKVKVLGNVHGNCRPEVKEFAIDSKWIFKLNKAKDHNYYNLDFTISNCATNYLRVNGNFVEGNIEGEDQKTMSDAVEVQIRIEELRERIYSSE